MKFTLDVGRVIVIGVIVILLLAFVGFLINAYMFRAQSYVDLKSSVNELKRDLFNEKYLLLTERISEMENSFNG